MRAILSEGLSYEFYRAYSEVERRCVTSGAVRLRDLDRMAEALYMRFDPFALLFREIAASDD